MSDVTLRHLQEPKLGFRFGQELEHPKDGLFLFGPLEDRANPAEMRIGLIGTPAGLDCFREWASAVRRYIPAVDADAAHHASWPGFEAVFGARWPEQPLAQLTVSENEIHQTLRLADRHEAIFKTVALFSDPIRSYLRRDEASPDMWFVVIPEEVHQYGRPKSFVPKDERVKGKQSLPARLARKSLREGTPFLFPEDREAAERHRFWPDPIGWSGFNLSS